MWHWSFQNLWPDVLVVFCQLLSVVFCFSWFASRIPIWWLAYLRRDFPSAYQFRDSFLFLENIYIFLKEFWVLFADCNIQFTGLVSVDSLLLSSSPISPLCFGDRTPLCGLVWFRIGYVAQAGPELKGPPAIASWMLKLHAGDTIIG